MTDKRFKVGCVGYATEQGLGRLAKVFFDQEVVDEMLIVRHPHFKLQQGWYPTGTPMIHDRHRIDLAQPGVDRFFGKIDACLFFETPFDWNLPRLCKQMNVKTVMVPMHEWWPVNPPATFDKWICPSLLDLDCFRDMPGAEFIPIPADPEVEWKERRVAHGFLHNAGHIGCRGHKGTLELLKAMRHVRSDLRLTVTCQDGAGLRRLRDQAPEVDRDGRITFVTGDLRRDDLFPDHQDVLVAPEKFNGLSLPLQEAFAAGMVVMTTDRFPANTWLPAEPLIPVSSFARARTQPGNLEVDECIMEPQAIAAVMDAWWGQDISALSLRGKAWAEENSWDRLRDRWIKAITG